MEPSIFDFLRGVLLPAADGDRDVDDAERARWLAFAMKVQQYTGPVQAKGLEDTAFYRYNPLLSLAEVGGDPQRFGRSPEEFHGANSRRRARWPHSMLATTTHDTKRSEDARLRLDALSEMPAAWARELSSWARINAANRTRTNGDVAPDRQDELTFYQSLLAVWPPEAEHADAALVARLSDGMVKAAKEAKLHTSWINDDQAYDEALRRFVARTLGGKRTAKFLAAFLPFQRRVARLGMLGSLAQVVLKVASPGVPDFYQGSELWDLSLVDPDNRRPVDFALRERLLAEIEPLLSPERDARPTLAEWLERWPDGRVKLYVTAASLCLRKRAAAVFLDGDYLPLRAVGEHAGHVVAFARLLGAKGIVTVVPRLVNRLTSDENPWPLGERCWMGSSIELPQELLQRELVNVFTGERLRPSAEGALPLGTVFGVFPVAMLEALS